MILLLRKTNFSSLDFSVSQAACKQYVNEEIDVLGFPVVCNKSDQWRCFSLNSVYLIGSKLAFEFVCLLI